MRIRSFLSLLALAAVMCLPLGVAAPASAESGAHRQPPPPPVDLPIVIDEMD